MDTKGKFILLLPDEFDNWLSRVSIRRKILLIQHHHTYIPAYKHFKGNNHFEMCRSMENSHISRGFAEIGQNFTTFPDGKIMVCRNLEIIPAGIKGANTNGICIENIGNFDNGNDILTKEQANSIILITRSLLKKFSLTANDQTVVYHHWYDLNTGKRIKKGGSGVTKTCPGTTFFGGNTSEAFDKNFLALLN